MLIKSGIILLVTLFSTFNANAATWNETNNKAVTAVQVLDHGGFVVSFDSVAQSYCTRSGTNSVYFQAGQNHVTQEGIKALLSAALTALSTGMSVDIVHDNDPDGYCFGRYFKLKKQIL